MQLRIAIRGPLESRVGTCNCSSIGIRSCRRRRLLACLRRLARTPSRSIWSRSTGFGKVTLLQLRRPYSHWRGFRGFLGCRTSQLAIPTSLLVFSKRPSASSTRPCLRSHLRCRNSHFADNSFQDSLLRRWSGVMATEKKCSFVELLVVDDGPDLVALDQQPCNVAASASRGVPPWRD